MAEAAGPTIAVHGASDFVGAAADAIADRVRRCVDARGTGRLVLAGGGTPKPIYAALSQRSDVPWSDVEFLWGDERCVGPDDPQSNYRMAHQALLRPIGARPEQVFRIAGEKAPEQACADYQQVLSRGRLDIVLLGMGGDGHTASLFPSDAASGRTDAPVLVTHSPKPPPVRISLSLPTLCTARYVVMLVSGAAKAERISEVWAETRAETPQYPAAAVRPDDGEWLWLLDGAAAARLPSNTKNEQTP